MGVYIKRLEKKLCAECMFRGYDYCLLTDEYIGVDAEYKPEECPLIEVKAPHGRLIDADVLCERLVTEWHTADENGKKIISEVMADVVTPIVVGTPTVIEAEVE